MGWAMSKFRLGAKEEDNTTHTHMPYAQAGPPSSPSTMNDLGVLLVWLRVGARRRILLLSVKLIEGL
jgi:hypothetical protein